MDYAVALGKMETHILSEKQKLSYNMLGCAIMSLGLPACRALLSLSNSILPIFCISLLLSIHTILKTNTSHWKMGLALRKHFSIPTQRPIPNLPRFPNSNYFLFLLLFAIDSHHLRDLFTVDTKASYFI